MVLPFSRTERSVSNQRPFGGQSSKGPDNPTQGARNLPLPATTRSRAAGTRCIRTTVKAQHDFLTNGMAVDLVKNQDGTVRGCGSHLH